MSLSLHPGYVSCLKKDVDAREKPAHGG